MALNIHDFLNAAMLHPGAPNFSIKKDKNSGLESIEPDVDYFDGKNIEWNKERSQQGLKAREALRKALKEQFGEKVANFACPSNDLQLDASSITHLIKVAESTASKNNILREQCVFSEKFMLSTEYIAQLRLAGDEHNHFYHSEYKKVIEILDDYENEVASLCIMERVKCLENLEAKAMLMQEKQNAFAFEKTGLAREKIMDQCKVTHHLLDGIREEIQMVKESKSDQVR